MVNINQFTEQLRMMPDQALQRVAMMYKEDPYIFPMVISEGMARKKLRASAQMQGPQGPQPKVVDQALMAMAEPPPQPQGAPSAGIAGLPTPNIQHMADGGIAGYDEPGQLNYSQQFAQHSEPVVRMAEGGVARYADQGLVQTTGDTLAQVQAPTMEQLQVLQAQLTEAERVLAAAAKSGDAQSTTQYAQAVQQLRDQIKAVAERSFGNRAQQVISGLQAGPGSAPPQQPPKAPLMPIPDVRIAGQTPPGAAPGSAPPARPTVALTPAATGPSRAETMLGETERQGLRRLYDMKMDAERRGDEERLQYEAGKPKGEAYAGMSERLKKLEEAEPGEREQAKGMAIFNAGLAMMAGGSQYALQNIARGALAGTSEYAGAMKELKQAAKERMKLEADIEQARRAEQRGDNETALKLMQRQNDRVDRLSEHMVDLGVKTGQSKAEIASKVDLLRTELSSRERIANAQIKAHDPLQLYRELDPEGKGNVARGYEAAVKAKTEGATIRGLALEMVKNPAELKMLQQTNPQLYAAVMAEVAKLGGSGGAGAGVDLSQWGAPQQVGGR